MTEELVISVIVPVYNVERYFASCLDSILSQDYKNLEIILINDGSTDFSLKIAETYAEKEDRIAVYNFENEGLAETRNRGLSVATGDWVTFVDADDMLLPGAIKMMMRVANETDAGIVEGKTICGKTHGNIKYKNFYKTQTFTPLKAIENVLYQKKLLPSMCGKLFKKELFDNLKFEKGILYEDLSLFYKVFERANIIAETEFPVYFYRTNEDSIIHTWQQHRLDVLKVTEDMEEYLRENYPDILPAAKDRRLSANFNMYALCSLNGEKKSALQCWEHIKKNRRTSLFNHKVRLKNKAGILLSYLGRHIFNIAARSIYK